MEVSLNKQHLENYNKAAQAEAVTEETMEAIVPDSWPDAQRVCGCCGNVLIRTKDCGAGRATVTGTVKTNVMYEAEDGATCKALTMNLPFSMEASDPAITENSEMIAEPQLLGCEGRVVNSRKLQVRVTVASPMKIFNKGEIVYCSEVKSPDNLEILDAEVPVLLTKEVKAKSFNVSDELQLDGSKPGASELLMGTATLSVTDSKMVGSKLVFKGNADIGIVYLTPDSTVESASFVLPFSQIIDMDGVEETDDAGVTLTLTSFDIAVADDYSEDLRRFEVNMNILAQTEVAGQTEINPIVDFYSTDHVTTAEKTGLGVESLLDRSVVIRPIRDQIQVDGQVNKILMTASTMPRQEISVQNGTVYVKQYIDVTVIYIDGNGKVQSGKKRLDPDAHLELLEGATAEVQCRLTEPIQATAAGNTIQLNGNVEFLFLCTAKNNMPVVTNATVDDAVIDRKNRPSAILVRSMGASIWDLGKKYQAKTNDIVAINGLSGIFDDIEGKMLLIPKVSSGHNVKV